MLYIAVKVVLVIIVLVACSIPIFYAIKWFSKNNKSIKIYPKFEIVEITNKQEMDIDTIKEAIRISKEILQKVK
jgi:hypothetical protein